MEAKEVLGAIDRLAAWIETSGRAGSFARSSAALQTLRAAVEEEFELDEGLSRKRRFAVGKLCLRDLPHKSESFPVTLDRGTIQIRHLYDIGRKTQSGHTFDLPYGEST